jgi:hypothetical protein
MFRWKARTLADAKAFIRLQTNLKSVELNKGDVVYKEGDMGKSMFFVDEEHGGKCYFWPFFFISHQYIHCTLSDNTSYQNSMSFCMRPHRRRIGSEAWRCHCAQVWPGRVFWRIFPPFRETTIVSSI